MKWETGRQGDVDVDCLGIRVKLNSPEAEAAFACQNEVDAIRNGMVKSAALSGALADWHMDKEGRINYIEYLVDGGLGDQQRAFVEMKENRGLGTRLFDHFTGKDTFHERLREYKEYVHVPPLDFK